MNYWTLTFISLCVADLALYIIFSILNKKQISDIASILLVPLCNILCCTLIWHRLPDSLSIVILLLLSGLFSGLTVFFFKHRKKLTFIKLSVISFILNILLWQYLYKTSFFIYSPSAFCIILSCVLTFIAISVVFVFFGRHNFSIAFPLFLFLIPSALLIFTASITFFCDISIFGILLLLGSLGYCASVALTAKVYKKEIFIEEKKGKDGMEEIPIADFNAPELSERKKAVITTVMITASQVLISASAVLMII